MEKKILKAGLSYTICNVILRGISFLTVPIFIRLLSPDEFGKYNIFISFESILFIFSGLTIHASIKNAYYDKKECYDRFIKNCIYLDFVNSVFLLIIANVICCFYQSLIDLTYQEVNLLVLSGFCQAVMSIYSAKLIMDYKSKEFIVVSFITVVAGISLSLFFIFTIFDFDHYLGRVYGGVAGQVIATLFILYTIFKNGTVSFCFSDWWYGLKISIPIIPHGLSQIALSSANRIMIKYIYSDILAGIFSFTYTISLIPQILFSSLLNVWEPWFFNKMSEGNYVEIKKGAEYFAVLISIVFALMSFVVPEIVKLLATTDYYDSIDISIIVLIGCYFATLYYIPCEVEYFNKNTSYIAMSTMCCALFNIIANYFLMQYFNYKIAAYVTMVAYFFYFVFHLYMTHVICKRWIFSIQRLLVIILLTVIIMSVNVLLISELFIRFSFLVFVLSLLSYKYRSVIKWFYTNAIRKYILLK